MESVDTLCICSRHRKFVAMVIDALEMTEKLSGGHRNTTFPCVEGVCGQWEFSMGGSYPDGVSEPS